MRLKIILPVITLFVGVLLFVGLSALKKPPEKKLQTVEKTSVNVEQVVLGEVQLKVESHGIALPSNQTRLVAQVSGKIQYISEKFNRGMFIKKGEILAVIEPLDYETVLIEAEANLASAKASLELEKARGQVAKDEWERIRNYTPTQLSLRKPQLAQEIARVKAAEAALKRAQTNLARTEIRAPYNAIVNQRAISLGSYANVGGLIGEVSNIEAVEIRLPVSRQDLSYLDDGGIGATVELATSDNSQRWYGRVVRNEGIIDQQSRMSFLVAQVNDPYFQLNEEQQRLNDHVPLQFETYVAASIYGKTIDHAVAIPLHLIKQGRIATADTQDALKLQTINIVRQETDMVIVNQGLENGTRIITTPINFPIDGMQLKIENETQMAIDNETRPVVPTPEVKTLDASLTLNN